MRIKILPVFLLVLCTGCATIPDPETMANAELDNRDELVCTMEKPTGSNLPKRVCRYRSDIERGDGSAERLMRNMHERAKAPSTGSH